MPSSDDFNMEPANKRIKSSDRKFDEIINDCYELQFNVLDRTEEQETLLKDGLLEIRSSLEERSSLSFGNTRVLAKINWGKCLSLLLEGGTENLKALSVLTGKLNPGAGLL